MTHSRTSDPPLFEVSIEGHVLSRHGIAIHDAILAIRFEMRGPAPSHRFLKDHVVARDPATANPLESLGGAGRYGDGSCHFVRDWVWSGEQEILLQYYSHRRVIAEERLRVPPATPDARALHREGSFLSFHSDDPGSV